LTKDQACSTNCQVQIFNEEQRLEELVDRTLAKEEACLTLRIAELARVLPHPFVVALAIDRRLCISANSDRGDAESEGPQDACLKEAPSSAAVFPLVAKVRLAELTIVVISAHHAIGVDQEEKLKIPCVASLGSLLCQPPPHTRVH